MRIRIMWRLYQNRYILTYKEGHEEEVMLITPSVFRQYIKMKFTTYVNNLTDKFWKIEKNTTNLNSEEVWVVPNSQSFNKLIDKVSNR